jgi:hypothetical protein
MKQNNSMHQNVMKGSYGNERKANEARSREKEKINLTYQFESRFDIKFHVR